MEHVNADASVLPGHTLKLLRHETSCDPTNVLDWPGRYASAPVQCSLHTNHTRAVGYVGTSCSSECTVMAYAGNLFQFPQLAYSCGADFLTTGVYPFFSRVAGPDSHQLHALLALANSLNWTNVGMFYEDCPDVRCVYGTTLSAGLQAVSDAGSNETAPVRCAKAPAPSVRCLRSRAHA